MPGLETVSKLPFESRMKAPTVRYFALGTQGGAPWSAHIKPSKALPPSTKAGGLGPGPDVPGVVFVANWTWLTASTISAVLGPDVFAVGY